MSDKKDISTEVVFKPTPFHEPKQYFAPEGVPLSNLLADLSLDPLFFQYGCVEINGEIVPKNEWSSVITREGQHVRLFLVPQGGSVGGGASGKDVTRLIATIAVVAIATAISGGALGPAGLGWLGPSFAAGGWGAMAGAAAVTIAGTLALGFLAPLPKQPDLKSSDSFSIAAPRNRLDPYGLIPIILGKHRIHPPFAATPFTEIKGDDQYVNLLFHCEGPINITELKFGETDIASYEDVETEILQGFSNDPPISLITNSTVEDSFSTLVPKADDSWIERTTSANPDRIEIVLIMPEGVVDLNKNGTDPDAMALPIRVQFKKSTDQDWKVLPEFHYVNKKHDTIRLQVVIMRGIGDDVAGPSSGARIVPDPYNDQAAVHNATEVYDRRIVFWVDSTNFPTEGQFDVRVSRGKPFEASFTTHNPPSGGTRFDNASYNEPGNAFSDTYFTLLRSIRDESPIQNITNLAQVAIVIKATDQLNGIPDTFNFIGSSIVNIWDGNDWDTVAESNNPAALFRWAALNNRSGQTLGITGVDDDSIQDFYEWCDDQGFECNLLIEREQAWSDVLETIAATGRGKVRYSPEGKVGIIIDKPRSVTTQMFNRRNISDFSFSKNLVDVPHVIRARFINEDRGYVDDERLIYRDGFNEDNAFLFEEIRYSGITRSDLVWRRAKFDLLQFQRRSTFFSFGTDLEHLACERGDRIRVQHPTIKTVSGYGRIAGITLTGDSSRIASITLDYAMTTTMPSPLGVRVRKSDGSFTVQTNATIDESGKVITFNPTRPLANSMEVGDLVSFGTVGEESVQLLVAEMEGGSDLSAKLLCVPYDPDLYSEVDEGDPPAWDSDVPPITADRRPAQPLIHAVVSNETVMKRGADGALIPVVRVFFTVPLTTKRKYAADRVLTRWKKSTDDKWRRGPRLDPFDGSFDIEDPVDIREGELIDIQIWTRAVNGEFSAKASVIGHEVIGATDPPPDVSTLTLTLQEDSRIKVEWELGQDDPIDLRGYMIRIGSTSDSWSTATPAHRGVVRDDPRRYGPLTPGNYRFFIKAVDLYGNESVNAKTTDIAIAVPNQPTNADATAISGGIQLTWINPIDEDFKHVDIFRRQTTTSPNDNHRVDTVAGRPGRLMTWKEFGLNKNNTYFYWLRAVNQQGQRSSLVGPIPDSNGISPLGTINDAGVINATSFAEGIEPVGIVGALPNPIGYTGPQIVYLTTDSKLYRYDPNVPEWTVEVPAEDITGQIVTSQLADGVITAIKIATGEIGTTHFAQGIEPVSVVNSLPNPSGYTGPKTVFLTTDSKLYRYTGSAWVRSVPTTDLTGQITSTQITDNAITTPKLNANAVTAAKIATNAITSDKIEANAVIAGKVAAGAINSDQIVSNAIQTTHLNANIISVRELIVGHFDNLIQNPGGETGTIFPHGENASSSGGAWSNAAGTVRSGGFSFRYNPANPTPQTSVARLFFNGLPGDAESHVESSADDEFYFQAYLRTAGTGGTPRANLAIRFYDPTNTIVNQQASSSVDLTTSWQKVEVSAKAGANARYVVFLVEVDNRPTASLTLVDDAYARQKMVGSIIVDGAITAAKIQALAIETSHLATNSITTAKIAANAVTTGQIAAGAVTATQIAAGAITTKQLAITDTNSYVVDSRTLQFWQDRSTSGQNATIITAVGDIQNASIRNSIPVDVEKVMEIELFNADTAGATWHHIGTNTPQYNVTPGKAYAFGCIAARTGGSTANHGNAGRMRVQWLSAGGDNLGFEIINLCAGGTGIWESYTGQGIAPANAVTARIGYSHDQQSSAPGSHRLWAAAPFFRLANAGTLIEPGGITTPALATNSVTTAKIAAGAITANKVTTASAVITDSIQIGQGPNAVLITPHAVDFAWTDFAREHSERLELEFPFTEAGEGTWKTIATVDVAGDASDPVEVEVGWRQLVLTHTMGVAGDRQLTYGVRLQRTLPGATVTLWDDLLHTRNSAGTITFDNMSSVNRKLLNVTGAGNARFRLQYWYAVEDDGVDPGPEFQGHHYKDFYLQAKRSKK